MARRNRRISSQSMLASFAERVSPKVREQLEEADAEGLRGDTAAALERLRRTAEALPLKADGDRVALGELAVVIATWAGEPLLAKDFVESLIERTTEPSCRGALYFHLSRSSRAEEMVPGLRKALHEFTVAGDLRGRAVTLAQMAWPTGDEVSPDHLIRMGREALKLAEELDDPWAVAFCAGRLAACEFYFDRPEALGRLRKAAEALPSSPDSVTAEIASLNQYNLATNAVGQGYYSVAGQAVEEGRQLAHGTVWQRRYDEVAALVAWRTGKWPAAREFAESGRAGETSWGQLAAAVLAAIDGEQAAKVTTTLVDEAVEKMWYDTEMRWLAQAIQAELRAVRREPSPMRDVYPLIEDVVRMGARNGWEDAMLVLARHDEALAREAVERLGDLWPRNPRGSAVHRYVQGLLAGVDGYSTLVEVAEFFEGLPEPVTAGQAMHAAAKVAPTIAEGNALRRRAIELFQSAGAERSLSAVLRDRALHRGPQLQGVPESQRHRTTGALTKREQEVAQLAAWGYTAQEIADELHISVATARHHLLRVREKFGGVPKRKLALLLASRERDA